jgi:subtilisin-like proprotein convertase family protein
LKIEQMDVWKQSLLLLHGVMLLAAGMAAAPLKPEYSIREHGRDVILEIATDELQVNGQRNPEKIAAQGNAEAARQHALLLSKARGKEINLVLYPQGKPRTKFNRRILTKDLLVEVEPGVDAISLGKAVGAKAVRESDILPGHFIFSAAEGGGALELMESLSGRPGVVLVEPQLASLKQKRFVPNDTYFPQQWYLRNTGQGGGVAGIDVNVTNVWDKYRGTNIVIGIIDDGLQVTHPDLSGNFIFAPSFDFNGNDGDPSPNISEDYHGTSVAGLAAARNNGVGVVGVAFEAKLAGLRLIALPETDSQDAAAMSHSNSLIHIKNCSWGPPECGFSGVVLEGPGPLMRAAMAQGVATGRGGKGEIYVFAAGNGGECDENVNYDGLASSVNVFAIGAISDEGKPTDYSEPGACLVAVAPSSSYLRQGTTTTDLLGSFGYNTTNATSELSNRDYTQHFGGTSSAAPVASGVMALILQANTNLTYRDLKEILLRSSKKVQPADPGWKTNSAGIPHHHYFGGGLINARSAVNMATNWASLGPVTNITQLQTNINLSIPDNNLTGITRTFTVTNQNFRVEHVALTMTAPHTFWGDLMVTLTSPSGMQSVLTSTNGFVDSSYQYQAWPLTSVRHWGEKATGTWTVRVADGAATYTGTLKALELKLYGSVPQAQLSVGQTNSNMNLGLKAAAPGWTYAIESSTNLVNWSAVTNVVIPTSGKTNVLDPVSGPLRFYRARLL